MSEFSEIEAFINDYRSKHPRTRYYPKEFWVRVLPLAREHGAAKVATAFGISKQHLFKKLALHQNLWVKSPFSYSLRSHRVKSIPPPSEVSRAFGRPLAGFASLRP